MISQHLAQFPKDKPFILHCAGGYRSMIAASILKQRGWDNFVDVVGGFNAIKNTDVERTEYVCPAAREAPFLPEDTELTGHQAELLRPPRTQA
jgi:hypothetical protein